MLRWAADEELNALIRRYYMGEAGLWEAIRQHIDDELRRRGIANGAYHIRLLRRDDDLVTLTDNALPATPKNAQLESTRPR